MGRVEYLDFEQLAENPANWKFHPPEQLSVIAGSIERLGHLKPLGTYNESTGRLLDGHGRKQLYAGKGLVPIWVVSLPEELEAEALATLDPSGWTAIADRKKFTALLAQVPKVDNDDLAKLLGAVKDTSKLLDQLDTPAAAEPAKDDDAASISIPLDSIWPSDNLYDVPSLLPELQADQVPHPVGTWGTVGHTRPMPGVWHFYVHDHKFEPLWRRPHRVLASRPNSVVEPNFSTTDQTPLALALWHFYRKRWLARYWQANGLRVFVDLNVEPRFNAVCDGLGSVPPNLLGVPRGWRAYASRAHANCPENLLPEWAVAREWSGIESPLFLVVGGGKQVKALAKEHGWVWVPEQIQIAHGAEATAA
jgi:Domain of unknown function (DUF4417)